MKNKNDKERILEKNRKIVLCMTFILGILLLNSCNLFDLESGSEKLRGEPIATYERTETSSITSGEGIVKEAEATLRVDFYKTGVAKISLNVKTEKGDSEDAVVGVITVKEGRGAAFNGLSWGYFEGDESSLEVNTYNFPTTYTYVYKLFDTSYNGEGKMPWIVYNKRLYLLSSSDSYYERESYERESYLKELVENPDVMSTLYGLPRVYPE